MLCSPPVNWAGLLGAVGSKPKFAHASGSVCATHAEQRCCFCGVFDFALISIATLLSLISKHCALFSLLTGKNNSKTR